MLDRIKREDQARPSGSPGEEMIEIPRKHQRVQLPDFPVPFRYIPREIMYEIIRILYEHGVENVRNFRLISAAMNAALGPQWVAPIRFCLILDEYQVNQWAPYHYIRILTVVGNQRLHILPRNLARLTFGFYFNQPVNDIVWPQSITHLTFGYRFDQPVDAERLPQSVTHLTFGWHFNQSIDVDRLPPNIQVLSLARSYPHPIAAPNNRFRIERR